MPFLRYYSGTFAAVVGVFHVIPKVRGLWLCCNSVAACPWLTAAARFRTPSKAWGLAAISRICPDVRACRVLHYVKDRFSESPGRTPAASKVENSTRAPMGFPLTSEGKDMANILNFQTFWQLFSKKSKNSFGMLAMNWKSMNYKNMENMAFWRFRTEQKTNVPNYCKSYIYARKL